MPLTRIEIENFTVFENITIPFNKGLNILVRENGVGKTDVRPYKRFHSGKRNFIKRMELRFSSKDGEC